MKRKTFGLIITFVLLLIIMFCALLYVYKKEKTFSFYAKITQITDNGALISPLGDNPLSGYSDIFVPIFDLKINDIVKIICLDQIRESYPPQITMVSYKFIYNEKTTSKTTLTNSAINSSQATSNDDIITTFNDYIEDADLQDDKITFQDTYKKIIDFIFYDGLINGVKFSDLTTSVKLKVIYLTLKLDEKIENKFPNYKEILDAKYKTAKDNMIIWYLTTTSAFCEDNNRLCIEAVNDFQLLKQSLNMTWEFIVNLSKNGVNNLTKWYDIYVGK